MTLVYLNERDQAIDRYRRCAALAPDDADVIVELAMLLFERRENDDLAEAEQLVDRASEMAPGAPTVLVCRAELVALQGDLATAGELYRRAIEALPPGSNQRRVYQERASVLGH